MTRVLGIDPEGEGVVVTGFLLLAGRTPEQQEEDLAGMIELAVAWRSTLAAGSLEAPDRRPPETPLSTDAIRA